MLYLTMKSLTLHSEVAVPSQCLYESGLVSESICSFISRIYDVAIHLYAGNWEKAMLQLKAIHELLQMQTFSEYIIKVISSSLRLETCQPTVTVGVRRLQKTEFYFVHIIWNMLCLIPSVNYQSPHIFQGGA